MNLHGVYLILGATDLNRHGLSELLDQAARAGVRMIQLREKSLTDRDLLALAQTVVRHLAPYRIPLIINDRLDIAAASGAQGVHLGSDDLPPAAARDLLGAQALIGLTIHSLDELVRAADEPVNYFGVGPVYSSPTKAALSPWGPGALPEVVRLSSRPVFAIGGINATNVDDVLATGVAGVCVVSNVCQAADPFSAARELVQRCSNRRLSAR